jgi:hypothetical protein
MSLLLGLACWGLRPEPRWGFAPATPLKSKNKNLPQKENRKTFCALPLVGTEHDTSKGD